MNHDRVPNGVQVIGSLTVWVPSGARRFTDALSFLMRREKALRCFPSMRLPGGRFWHDFGFWLLRLSFHLMSRKTFDAFDARIPKDFFASTLQRKLLRKFPLDSFKSPALGRWTPLFLTVRLR